MNFISRLEKSDGEVAVFDATNTTRERRKYLYQRVVLEKGNNFVSSFEINRSSIFDQSERVLFFMLFSSHFGNFGFWLFLATKLRKYYVIVCLFFISSCLANRKHHTENHATKVTKEPKTKLPKYVLNNVGLVKKFIEIGNY